MPPRSPRKAPKVVEKQRIDSWRTLCPFSVMRRPRPSMTSSDNIDLHFCDWLAAHPGDHLHGAVEGQRYWRESAMENETYRFLKIYRLDKYAPKLGEEGVTDIASLDELCGKGAEALTADVGMTPKDAATVLAKIGDAVKRAQAEPKVRLPTAADREVIGAIGEMLMCRWIKHFAHCRRARRAQPQLHGRATARVNSW